MSRARGRGPRGMAIPAAAGIAFLALPLAGLLSRVPWRSLVPDLLSEPVTTALRLSLLTSTLALAVSLVLGVPLAHALARRRFRWHRVIRSLVVLPLVLPPVVGGIALQTVWGRDTLIGRPLHDVLGVTLPFSTAGAVLAEAFVAFPFLVLTVEAGLHQAGTALEEAAATLGAGPWRRFLEVTLPALGPTLAAGSALCWARALGEFGATITFAGSFPGSTQTLPLAAYAAFEGAGGVERAITLSVLLLAIALAVLVGMRGRWTAAR